MRHILSVLVENHPGVLRKVAGLFSRRGYNIDSLVVSETENEEISRMTIAVQGDDDILEQVIKQLSKLVDVIKIEDISNRPIVNKQLLLIKVKADIHTRIDIITLMDVFRARIAHIGRDSLIVEATGEQSKIDAIIETLKPFGIIELAKTGTVAMLREEEQ
ncbi:MAG: acetolactate synthase small subunit [Clostridiales bacterium]|nr:acetolactate synthase small subunit [Clostridiales bacterium]